MTFNEILAILRKENDVTQSQLGERIGVTETTIKNWESGKTRPNLNRLVRLADFFRLPLAELLGLEPLYKNYSQEEVDLICRFRKTSEPLRTQIEELLLRE